MLPFNKRQGERFANLLQRSIFRMRRVKCNALNDSFIGPRKRANCLLNHREAVSVRLNVDWYDLHCLSTSHSNYKQSPWTTNTIKSPSLVFCEGVRARRHKLAKTYTSNGRRWDAINMTTSLDASYIIFRTSMFAVSFKSIYGIISQSKVTSAN